MIEANEAAAETLEEKAPLGLFRVHAKPDLSKLYDWAKAAKEFGFEAGEIPSVITPAVVQHWLEQIESKRYSYIIRSMLVRSLQRAEYAPDNIGHFGLASESYTHFTSPIRRYPDLIVHRLLKKYVFKEDYRLDDEWMQEAAGHTSVTERNADEAEREIDLYKKMIYLRENSEKIHTAYIHKVTPGGLSIFLTELLMFGFIDNEVLPIKGYRSGKGKYFAGDSLTVQWSHTDWDRLEASFAIESVGATNDISRSANKDKKTYSKKTNKPGHYRKFAGKRKRR
jgi:ribonuclease R